MNIALCLEAYKPYTNGVITHVSMLRDSLEKQGHSCLIVTADPTIKHHIVVDGVLRCPAIAMKNIYGYGLASPFSKSRVRALLNFEPDVIHIHTELSIGVFALIFARLYKVPICYTLHTMYEDYSHYLFKNKFTLKAVQPAGFAYFRNFVAQSDVMISPSEKAIDFVSKIGIKNKNVVIMQNTIDTETFNPKSFTSKQIAEAREELGIARSDFVGIFVGRLGIEKSVDELIAGWGRLIGNLKGHKLLIIGDGPCAGSLKAQASKLSSDIIFTGKIEHSDIAKYFAMSNYYITASLTEMMSISMLEKAQASKLSSDIIFTGKIEHSDIAKYFAMSNYYITASLTEMMSISMLEAMAMALPCVLRYDEQNKQQVEDGVTGFIRDTVDDMCDVILELQDMSEAEYGRLCENVRNYAVSLSSDTATDKMIELYESAIKIHKSTKFKKPLRLK